MNVLIVGRGSIAQKHKLNIESFDMSVTLLSEIIKNDIKKAGRVIYTSLQAIVSCANLLYPFMPSTSESVRGAIPKITECKWGVNEIKRGVELGQLELLFKKFD